MKVILLSYIVDGTDVGEALIAYKWAKALSHHVDLTVLAFERPGRVPLKEQLPNAEVITWPEPLFLRRFERFNAMLKPAYPLLFRKVRHWMREQNQNGRVFNIAHQIMPQAARYPSPFCGMQTPYIMGPLGGALPTPPGFRSEVNTAKWYTRFRVFDQWRFNYDPWLRRSYSEAALILGVAPYMATALSTVPLKRFETTLELGIDNLPPMPSKQAGHEFRLLHVGRGIRTKGLRDVVRAMARLKDLPNITLTSAGSGEEIKICQEEAKKLGIENRVRFLGKIPHSEVEKLYQESDIFTFPSFREPAGGVFYEAMRWGLPVISVNYGGPAAIVNDDTGIKLPVTTPEALEIALAKAIRELYFDPARRKDMGAAARHSVKTKGLWDNKAKAMLDLYEDILGQKSDTI